MAVSTPKHCFLVVIAPPGELLSDPSLMHAANVSDKAKSSRLQHGEERERQGKGALI